MGKSDVWNENSPLFRTAENFFIAETCVYNL